MTAGLAILAGVMTPGLRPKAAHAGSVSSVTHPGDVVTMSPRFPGPYRRDADVTNSERTWSRDAIPPRFNKAARARFPERKGTFACGVTCLIPRLRYPAERNAQCTV